MKQVLVFIFLWVSPVLLLSQQRPDSGTPVTDSIRVLPDTSISIIDSSALKIADSLAQVSTAKDSLVNLIIAERNNYAATMQKIVDSSYYLNAKAAPVAMSIKPRRRSPMDDLFYLLVGAALFLGFFRFIYTRYFNNLFRVFFNTSLRQTQLTDQLLQEKLPSLFFNIAFVIIAGVYVYLILKYFNWISGVNFWEVTLYCAISMGGIYFIKFISLKFTGWVTGFRDITNTYVFIIFLINKILAVLLLPFAVVIAFASPVLATAAIVISLLLIGLMFLLRFFRSFGLLQHQLKISRLHFLMYVAGIEILPLLLIYKGLVLLLSKNV